VTGVDSLAVVAAWDRDADADAEGLLTGITVLGGVTWVTDAVVGPTATALSEEDTTGLGMSAAELEAAVVTGATEPPAETEPPDKADGVAKTAVRAGGAVDRAARAPVKVGPREEAVFS